MRSTDIDIKRKVFKRFRLWVIGSGIPKGEIFMNKAFRLKDLDCAACAAKLQSHLEKIDGINSVSVNFIYQKMIVDFDEAKKDEVFAQIKSVTAKVEPEVKILGL